jgi:F-type H+-transporting ATPase subunit gamma
VVLLAESIKVYRQRIKSVQSTKKITKAMELIAASRIAKAQARIVASRPYSEEITRVLSAVTSQSTVTHPLTTGRPDSTSAAVIVVTSDRGLAGAYSASAIKVAEGVVTQLQGEGKSVALHVIGRKGVAFYSFRKREIAGKYTGFSEQPTYADAKAVGSSLIEAFVAGEIDEIHLISTDFVSMLTQRPVAHRLLPLEELPEAAAAAAKPDGVQPLYEFEPEPEEVLDALLPKYVTARIYAGLLESAASESAARRRACKSASDNASDIIKDLTRRANQARQAQITQEISEIVGGAEALAGAH